MLNILISKSIINKFLKTSITAKFASIKANQYSIFYKALLSQKSYKHNSIYNIKKFNFTTNLQEDIHNIKFKISYPNMLKPEEHKIAESITITETCVEVFI